MIRSKVNTIIPRLTRHIVALVCVSVLATLSVRAEVPGTGKLSGTVTASQAFTAAQVYIRNVDLGIVYMVYTNQGRYRAVALFPGNYEVSVSTKHLESDAQTVTIAAGDTAEVNLSMSPLSSDTPQLVIPAGRTAMESGRSGDFEYASYDEIYPPGRGKEVAEQVCMVCHGENFFPTRPGTERQWMSWIDHMVGSTLGEQDPTRYGQGLLAFRSSTFRFGRDDRDALLEYVVKNFGPDSTRRRVAIEKETPIDEEALGKAMYIEYYLAVDGPNEGVNAEPWARDRVGRYGQDPRFDAEGNVWLVDRGIPHRLVKLDPRTNEQREWLYPDPRNGNHEILIDPSGMIWLPEHRGRQNTTEKRLLGFNSKTEEWTQQISMDPDNVVRNPTKFLQSLAMDSKGNIYVGWIMGGALSKWDRATGEVSVFRIPTPHAIPYGVVADKNDNIWIALWSGGKIVKFDTSNNSWTEYTTTTYPAHTRRLNVDKDNNIWWGIYSAGKRDGKLVKLDQSTGKMTEWTIPQQNAEPYDVAPDPDGNIWAPDVGQRVDGESGATLWRFNPQTEE
ncbi:MAG: carboxypeptidase regulatory-like domain-containing protein, partial [Planctomycetes bacterium]|nr:carboxypeptidase regulatory-like domain-containing protein [Planctomycetota bacterium]